MLDERLQIDDMAPVQRKPMQVTLERSFFAALRALCHLYFQLEHAGLELHSNCALRRDQKLSRSSAVTSRPR
jgi:hypothetical protein